NQRFVGVPISDPSASLAGKKPKAQSQNGDKIVPPFYQLFLLTWHPAKLPSIVEYRKATHR
ncbi:MAG: hypothetical protein VX796_12835, partial [Pseudomonadota bacterium]|nr:hypothetical protein [Pseudomonadota bacterium]